MWGLCMQYFPFLLCMEMCAWRQLIKVNNFFGDFVDGWIVVFKFIYVD